jgi:hypothetical protein
MIYKTIQSREKIHWGKEVNLGTRTSGFIKSETMHRYHKAGGETVLKLDRSFHASVSCTAYSAKERPWNERQNNDFIVFKKFSWESPTCGQIQEGVFCVPT